ncbi:hypothetical protein QTP86_024996 [Hemibagrus guttatus]|nr:hypothetical protein QTP86_024996 [Hemibagrus guttatus]
MLYRGDNTLDHVYTNIAEAYRAISLPHLGQSDHLSLFMLPKYTPLIKRVKPSVKTVKATSGAQTDITTYTSSVLDHINMCIDNITTVKHVKHFPNQKPWMNSEVRLLLKARDAAFKSGDTEDYSRARANLKKGIRKAKQAHKLHIVEHFHNNSNPRHMWKGTQTITDHKPSIQSLPTSNAFLPDELNHFFARFDKGVIHHTRNADPSMAVHPISLSTTEVHSALSRVDPDCKTLQRIVRTAEKIIGVSLPSIMDIYSTRCIRKANNIVDDLTHPSHTLFTLLPSRKSGGGELLASTGDIVRRWKEYFEDLLNPTDTPSVEEPEAEDSEVDSFITQAEVTEAVQPLLGGKAPGVDSP